MVVSSAPTTPTSRPRRGLRYSLRALLILVTLASVGLWYWFRVPFVAHVETTFPRPELIASTPSDPFQSGGDPFAPPPAPPTSKQVQRFHRVLWGDPIRHGLTELYYPSGEHFGEDHWREGALHGPSVRWYASGELLERGEYVAGKRQGLWQGFDKQGRPWFEVNYDQDVPHGDARWRLESGKPARTVRSNHGEVVEIDGRKVDDLLGRAYRQVEIDNPQIAELFRTPTTWDFYDTPLKNLADYLAERYGINVVLDRASPWTEDTPVTASARHMTGATFLAVVLDQLAYGTPRGTAWQSAPAATYRHGCVWITTIDDAKTWKDRTGVSELLKSPPAEVSQRALENLKRNLNRPLSVAFVRMSAADVAKHLRSAERLPIDWAGTTNGPKVSTGFRDLALRHILGAVCEQNDLHVCWGDGASLIMEPQDRGTP